MRKGGKERWMYVCMYGWREGGKEADRKGVAGKKHGKGTRRGVNRDS